MRLVVMRKAEGPSSGSSIRGKPVGTVSKRQGGSFVKKAPGDWEREGEGQLPGADAPEAPTRPPSPEVASVHDKIGHLVDRLSARDLENHQIPKEVRSALKGVKDRHLAAAIRSAGGRPEKGRARMMEQLIRKFQKRHASQRRRDAIEHPDDDAIEAAKSRIAARGRSSKMGKAIVRAIVTLIKAQSSHSAHPHLVLRIGPSGHRRWMTTGDPHRDREHRQRRQAKRGEHRWSRHAPGHYTTMVTGADGKTRKFQVRRKDGEWVVHGRTRPLRGLTGFGTAAEAKAAAVERGKRLGKKKQTTLPLAKPKRAPKAKPKRKPTAESTPRAEAVAPQPKEPTPVTDSPTPAGSFSERVLDAVKRTTEGRFGDYLVSIADTFDTFKKNHPDATMEQFKADLLTAHRSREVFLVGADLPQSLDSSIGPRWRAGMTAFRSSEFYFIRSDTPAPRGPSRAVVSTTPTMGKRIVDAATSLARGRTGRVRIADLKEELGNPSDAEFHKALLQLETSGKATLYPLDDPREITARDRAAMVRTPSGSERHLLYLA